MEYLIALGLVLMCPLTYIYRKKIENSLDAISNCRSYYKSFYKNYSQKSFSQYCVDNIDSVSWFTDPINKNYILLIGFAGLCLLSDSANNFYYKNYSHTYKNKYKHNTEKKLVLRGWHNILASNPFMSKSSCDPFSLLPIKSNIIGQTLPVNYTITSIAKPRGLIHYNSLHNRLSCVVSDSPDSLTIKSNELILYRSTSNLLDSCVTLNKVNNFESPKYFVSNDFLKQIVILNKSPRVSKFNDLSLNNVTLKYFTSGCKSSLDYTISPGLIPISSSNNSSSRKKHLTGSAVSKFILGDPQQDSNGSLVGSQRDWLITDRCNNNIKSSAKLRLNSYPKYKTIAQYPSSLNNSYLINNKYRNGCKLANFSNNTN